MGTPSKTFDIARVRADFPILDLEVRPGVPLVYLDSAATSQKPLAVIEAMNRYYQSSNANIHRGIHTLAEKATADYEGSRERIARFINAAHSHEVIFTRNTTESINLVAYSWARKNMAAGDLLLISEMEHHSNLVPWYILAEERGVQIEYIPVFESGLLDLDTYKKLLEKKPKLVSFTHMSNVLGTINPVQEMIAWAHDVGAITLIDGAQAVPHFAVDVQALDADLYAFSSHKMLGPTGVGVLYGKTALLEAMPPFLGGGDMIKRVEFGSFVANDLPHKFEAGTPAIAEVIGLGAAVDYLNDMGMDAVAAHEADLTAYAIERLEEVPGVRHFGPPAAHKGGAVSFDFDGTHAHDVSEILDKYGVAVRAGHHCAMPLHKKFGITATTRASFYIYNTRAEIDQLIEGLYKVKEVFG
jgi:cysteine desulfurase/selenocysteine lyase